jgi:mRNA interferase RelE/StbE
MAYTVRVAPSAVKSLARLPANVRKRIGREIDSLAGDPFPPEAVKLTGAKGDFFRLRTGGYRIIYQVKGSILVVLVVRIGHRKDIYRRL